MILNQKVLKRQKAYLSLRDRLILNFVFFGVVIILVIGAFSYYTARDVLLDRTFDQLTSVRVVKKRQIESFFADRSRDIKLIMSSQEARELLELVQNGEHDQAATFNKIFSIYGSYLARYLSSQEYYRSFYIVNEKGIALKIPVNGAEGSIDAVIEPSWRLIPEALWESVRATSDISINDLEKDKSEPGLYIGAPLLEDGKMIGMIAMEISIEAINKIMYENNPYEGLGESGESYLVGNDLLMRSRSRFQDNSILNTRVSTTGVKMALQGKDSTAIISDYRGIKVLSSFSRVDLSDLHWVILAEIDLAEALVPLNAIRKNILLISSFIVLFLFMAAVFLSARITSPLIRLKNAAEKIGEGDFDTGLKTGLNNEIGDLTNSFNHMAGRLFEMTSELKMERIKRLRSVIDGQELERQRLSRELHDGLGQMLIALKLRLENTKGSDHCDTLKIVKEVKQSFDSTIDEVRRMSNDLMPAVLYEFGITTALRNLVDEVSENSGITGEFNASGKFEHLDKTTKTYLYRIAQEAVTNAVKHAGASIIKVKIAILDGEIMMSIEDNGTGFDIAAESATLGNGLHNMRERTGLLQGGIDIKTGKMEGTLITIIIPHKTEEL